MTRDGYRLGFFPILKRYRCLNGAGTATFLKKTHNEDIKNLFGHIPYRSRYHGALTNNGYQTVNIHNTCSPLYDFVMCRPYRVNPVTVLMGKENNQSEVLKMTCDT
ncbi:hypothetical protein EYF80_041150 [Liparis tanakae]|uniref:Uncharacterized protein n=1 Tax=Liparis tanakae TaxID=230148 RepID=A0A4Z2G4Z8_9TELE|nr:hypothetical protein EYF80_041150 [Liparis tanakae]